MEIKKGNTYIKIEDINKDDELLMFKVEITETLQKTINIAAKDENEAYERISDMYHNSDIVLDSECFVGSDISVLKNEEKNNSKHKSKDREER